MLSFVREALIATGRVSPKAKLICNIRVSTGDNISMEVCDSGRRWYYVKASCHSDLTQQFENCRLARERFHAFAPEPITHTRLGGWSILITHSVDHAGVRAADLAGPSKSSPLAASLVDFFATAKTSATAHCGHHSHDAFMEELRAYFLVSPDTADPVLHFVRNLDKSVWANIPYIPQHGDFVLNNLGRAKDRLVVFDWEDYGATGLAGFDICLMRLSIGGMNATTASMIQQNANASGHLWSLTEPACAASGLPYETFRSAVPIYLLAFRYLKRNYGSEIRTRIDDILFRILPRPPCPKKKN